MVPKPKSHLCPAVWGALRGTFVNLFCLYIYIYISEWDFGEIYFTNDRIKVKINVNPTSWDYSMPF